jgi:hypothetical protein
MIGSAHHRTVEPVGTAGQSVGELVKQASEQLSELVRDELRLAHAELAAKGKRARIGGGMLGVAAVFGLIALGALAAAAIAALSLVLPVWAAALIVAGGLFAAAGILALAGKKEVGRAMPPTPEQAIGSVKADVHEIKERAHR